MREQGVRGLLVYCADYRYSHSIAIAVTAGRMRSSDLEPPIVCGARGKRCADVRPDLNWNEQPVRRWAIANL